MMRILTLLLLILCCVCPLHADTPLTPAKARIIQSSNKKFEVTTDPKKGTKCVNLSTKKMLWKIPGWYRSVFLCDDGRHFITGYYGLNLLSRNYNGSDVMLTFWKDGKVIKTVTVDELIPNKKILKPTASHYSWGYIYGLSEEGLLVVMLEDKSVLYFDPTTGQRMVKVKNQK